MIKANIGLIAATVKTNVNFLVLVRDYRVYGFRIMLALINTVLYFLRMSFLLAIAIKIFKNKNSHKIIFVTVMLMC